MTKNANIIDEALMHILEAYEKENEQLVTYNNSVVENHNALLVEKESLTAENARLREFIAEYALEYGYSNRPNRIATGGHSTLELAFSLLGWDDPHYIDDRKDEQPETRKQDATCKDGGE